MMQRMRLPNVVRSVAATRGGWVIDHRMSKRIVAVKGRMFIFLVVAVVVSALLFR
jgi:uncharacterized membrane protein AbrB (regulator of aidB expression)